MPIIAIGDQAAANVWFPYAKQCMHKLLHTYRLKKVQVGIAAKSPINHDLTGKSMMVSAADKRVENLTKWYFPTADVKVCVRMIAGQPQAWIYTGGIYCTYRDIFQDFGYYLTFKNKSRIVNGVLKGPVSTKAERITSGGGFYDMAPYSRVWDFLSYLTEESLEAYLLSDDYAVQVCSGYWINIAGTKSLSWLGRCIYLKGAEYKFKDAVAFAAIMPSGKMLIVTVNYWEANIYHSESRCLVKAYVVAIGSVIDHKFTVTTVAEHTLDDNTESYAAAQTRMKVAILPDGVTVVYAVQSPNPMDNRLTYRYSFSSDGANYTEETIPIPISEGVELSGNYEPLIWGLRGSGSKTNAVYLEAFQYTLPRSHVLYAVTPTSIEPVHTESPGYGSRGVFMFADASEHIFLAKVAEHSPLPPRPPGVPEGAIVEPEHVRMLSFKGVDHNINSLPFTPETKAGGLSYNYGEMDGMPGTNDNFCYDRKTLIYCYNSVTFILNVTASGGELDYVKFPYRVDRLYTIYPTLGTLYRWGDQGTFYYASLSIT